MGGIGMTEILLIVIIAVLVYGKDLPSAARKAARAYGKVRRYLTDVKDEFTRHIPEDDLDLRRDVEEALEEADRKHKEWKEEKPPGKDFDPSAPPEEEQEISPAEQPTELEGPADEEKKSPE